MFRQMFSDHYKLFCEYEVNWTHKLNAIQDWIWEPDTSFLGRVRHIKHIPLPVSAINYNNIDIINYR